MAKGKEKKEKKPGIDFGIGNTLRGIFGGLTDAIDWVTGLILGKKRKGRRKRKRYY